MQVILKEDIHNLGKSGDVVNVKPGYGRNYLVPQGLAFQATAGNIKQVEHQKKIIAAKNAASLKEAQALSDKVSQVEVTLERSVGEGDKLFGSVTSRDVAEALAAKGVNVDSKKLVIKEPIKSVGFHSVEVKLGQGVTATVKVVVVAKQ